MATKNAYAETCVWLQGQGHPGHLAGGILVGGLALGECKAFRFVVKPSGQCLTALPPEELGKKKPNRGPIKFRKRENWGLIEVKDEEEQAAGRTDQTLQTKPV